MRLGALDQALSELEEAIREWDEAEVWRRTRDVLEWLYRCEEREKTADPDYYTKRDRTAPGQTLAGLIWVRGLVDHHDADVRKIVQQRLSFWMNVNGKPTRLVARIGDQVMQARIGEPQWPLRAELPQGQPEKRRRDFFYDLHVAGRAIVPPLGIARNYLASLGSPGE